MFFQVRIFILNRANYLPSLFDENKSKHPKRVKQKISMLHLHLWNRMKNDIIFLILSIYLLYDHNLMINNRRMPLFSVLMLRKKYWKMARTLGWSLTLKVWIQMTPSASFPMRRASLCYFTWRLCLGVQVRVETYTVLFLNSCIYTKKHVLPFNGQFCFVEWGRKYE